MSNPAMTFQAIPISTHATHGRSGDCFVKRFARRMGVFLLTLLTGCTGVPEGVVPVSNFELDRYLGKWYEIARLDHSFERGLEQVSAEYSLQSDGSVRVVNRGYSPEDEVWRQVEGKARFVGKPDIGHLKVSFFGPFYSSYVVFELDSMSDQTVNYQYAFVSGYSKSYLWLLSRTPTVSDDLMAHFRARAAELGFPVDELITVVQQPDSN